jgi:Domain of unknown function (DUF1996)
MTDMARSPAILLGTLLVLVLGAAAPRAAVAKRGELVNFLARCSVSRVASDDPIVFPGHPGWSHSHTFFGNTSTDAYSTLTSLRGGATTCRRRSETAAYWVPTLLREGSVVRATGATAYYTVREGTGVRAYPPGLKVVAGDAHAVRPQSLEVVWWNCGPFGSAKASVLPPARCTAGGVSASARRHHAPALELHVRFPDCWDGRRVDTPDHRTHMAYSSQDKCPRSHPVLVPSLTLIVHYATRSGRGVELASGGQTTGHADFFNAWNQSALARIVSDCSHGRPHCGRH